MQLVQNFTKAPKVGHIFQFNPQLFVISPNPRVYDEKAFR